MNKLFLFVSLFFFFSCRNPFLYQINTRPWLYELSKNYGQNITKLKEIPLQEFDILAQNGIEIVWMMGVWKLGPLGLNFSKSLNYYGALDDLTEEDIIGSPFAITEYVCNPDIGTDDDLIWLRKELNSRGMKLMLDFVPNHSAADCPWVDSNPYMYIQSSPELINTGIYNSRGYAYGADSRENPWKDVLQYNYWEPKTIEVMKENFKKVVRFADAVRCDRAYLILNGRFGNFWKPELEHYNYSQPETEFWSDAIKEVREINPNVILLAESYNYEYSMQLIELGFNYCYDEELLHHLSYSVTDLKEFIKDKNNSFFEHFAHFVENHDIQPIVMVCASNYQKAMAAGTIAATVGGLTFIHHGQWAGKKYQLNNHLRRANYETDNNEVKYYYRRLNKILTNPAFRSSNFYYIDNMTGLKKDDFVAFIKEEGKNHYLVVVNYSDGKGCAKVPIYNIQGYQYCLLHDALNDQEYIKNLKEVQDGMEVCLDAWETQILQYNYFIE